MSRLHPLASFWRARVAILICLLLLWSAGAEFGSVSPDFNSNGKPDLVWQNNATGEIAVWFMDGVTYQSHQSLSIPTISDTNWKIVGIGDFNGNGKPDLVWQNDATGEIAVWFMDGVTYQSHQSFSIPTVNTNWKIVGVADFNDNGKPDLVWQNNVTGEIAIWFMDGVTYQSHQSFSIPTVSNTNWKIAGIADFNSNGKPDLVWQNYATGEIAVWFMDGVTYQSHQSFSIPIVTDPSWRIVGVADFNDNGKPDLVWQNNVSGEITVWFMDGVVYQSHRYFSIPAVGDTNWKIRNR